MLAQNEVYRPAIARIRRQVRVVICPACVDGFLNVRGAITNEVYWVLWRPFKVSLWIRLVSVAHKGGRDIGGAPVVITQEYISQNATKSASFPSKEIACAPFSSNNENKKEKRRTPMKCFVGPVTRRVTQEWLLQVKVGGSHREGSEKTRR